LFLELEIAQPQSTPGGCNSTAAIRLMRVAISARLVSVFVILTFIALASLFLAFGANKPLDPDEEPAPIRID
jgi:hypothetical protein